ncbi:uncharacterized protein L969DRAFT_85937 [Mixia osmundae IAM 14324]|uniref:uncharacterized protein n=1 Tax=Mixia osmundae (strain CBS 9802 / IAM 14324 / JCM 22182 / KY 12970) TaxID=764103 RepID=UPI0004A54AD0|nr:uncharacterized protein L969DRAFT_85937 [Mixia osmundae IAM 14324]KEI40716.1 hypothetical protein L969DRAFT_85937 [Mixia osmundae IAM 14324]
MAEEPPEGAIRPFKPEDRPFVRYLVGASRLELAAFANSLAFTRPASLAFLLIASTSFIYIFKWVPNFHVSDILSGATRTWTFTETAFAIMEALYFLPGLAAVIALMIGTFELRHKMHFDIIMRRVMGEEDVRDIEGFYNVVNGKLAQDSPSGFWVLEFDERIIGCMSLDGERAGELLDSFEDKGASPNGKSNGVKAIKSSPASGLRSRKRTQRGVSNAGKTREIRHLTTSLTFREIDVDADMIEFALKYAFAPPSGPPADRVVISVYNQLEASRAKTLVGLGFTREGPDARVKSLIQTGRWAKLERVMETFWPLDLRASLYEITREQWTKRSL